MVPGAVGSNPIIHPKKTERSCASKAFFCCLFTGDSAYLYSLVLADEKTLLKSPKKHSDIVKKCFMISLLFASTPKFT